MVCLIISKQQTLSNCILVFLSIWLFCMLHNYVIIMRNSKVIKVLSVGAYGGEIMIRYSIKRLLFMIPILFAVAFVIFALMETMPGTPATIILGPQATQEAIDLLNEQLGHDRHFMYRFGRYMFNAIINRDLGISYVWGRPVWPDIVSRLPVTFLIAFNAMVVSSVIGIIVGVLSAVKQYSLFDKTATVISLFLSAVPSFWLAMLLIYFFALVVGVLPSSGAGSWRHFVMPAFSLGIPFAAWQLRYTRSAMLETIRQDYIDTAYAKGVPDRYVIWRHAFKNAVLVIITITGNNFRGLIGGAVVTETIFAIPGLGSHMVSAINRQDVPVVMGSMLVLTAMSAVIILIIDLLHALADPRVKARFTKR